MSVFDRSDGKGGDNASLPWAFPEGAFQRLNNAKDDINDQDPAKLQDIIINEGGGGGGGGTGTVTSVDFDEVNDSTAVISGVPITTAGTITRTAVDAGEDAFVMWDESAGEKVYWPYQNLVDLIEEGGGGGGTGCMPFWTRFAADGTEKVGSGNITPSRVSAGKYLLTGGTAFEEVGGFAKYGVLATVSAAAGDGGDGVSPFLSFSGYDVEITDVDAGNFFYYPEENELVLLGQNTDDFWRHDLDNFTTAAAQTDAEDIFRAIDNEGCRNREGTAIWVSGDSGGGGIDLRHFNLATGVITHFPATDTIVIAATETYIIVYEGNLKKYNFNLGTGSLGSVIAQWTTAVYYTEMTWDADGRLWHIAGTNLLSIDPSITGSGTPLLYALPSTPPLLTWYSTIIFDTLRNCLYVPFANSGIGAGWVFKVSNWQSLVSQQITWEMVLDLGNVIPVGIWHDTTTDILFIGNYNTSSVVRAYVPTWTIIDSTPIGGALVPYAYIAIRHVYYLGKKGYIIGTTGGEKYFIELQFDGDPIPGFGGGSGSVSSVVVPMYEIISTTQAYVYTFRSTNPPSFVDAECTVEFVHCDEADVGGGGGGGGGPIGSSDLTMTGIALLGRDTADEGAVEELTPEEATALIQPELVIVSGPAFIGNLASGAGFYEEITPEEAADAIEPYLDPPVHGQVKLRDSATDTQVIRLDRYNGTGGIIVDGLMFRVPTGGVEADVTSCYVAGVAAQTLAASTLYYVFVFDDSGTLELDFYTSAGLVTDGGVVVKSTDATRTYVGSVFTNSSGEFYFGASPELVRSWFHNTPQTIQRYASGVGVATNASMTEVSSTLRADVVALPSERISIQAYASSSSVTSFGIAPGVDNSPYALIANTFIGTGITGTSATGAYSGDQATGRRRFSPMYTGVAGTFSEVLLVVHLHGIGHVRT